MIKVDVIETLDEFQALERDWNALVEGYAGGTLFLTHEWLRTWYRFFGTRHRLQMLILREGGQLVGAVPLVLEIGRWRKCPLRTLTFLTDPMSANVRSDFILPHRGAEAVAAVVEHLATRAKEWDFCVLDSIPEESALWSLLTPIAKHAGLVATEPELYWVLHYLPVRGTWEEYLQAHSRYFRYNLRREEKKLGSMEIAWPEDPQGITEGLEIFRDLETRSLKRRKDDYTSLDDHLAAYYRTLFGELGAVKRAMVGVLRVDGRPIAATLLGRYRDVVYTLNDVFDPLDVQRSPGHLLRGGVARYGWDHGLAEVDFCGYGPHIQRWRTTPRRCFRIILGSGTMYERLLAVARRIGPAVRRAVPSLFPPPPAPRPGDRGVEA